MDFNLQLNLSFIWVCENLLALVNQTYTYEKDKPYYNCTFNVHALCVGSKVKDFRDREAGYYTG